MQTSVGARSREYRGTGTRVVAAALGVAVGVSGLDHGFFETLQGNAPTPGLIVQAIGPGQRMWLYGTEEAFTLVPNFLVTGLLAIAVGVLTILWSVRFLDRPKGVSVLLLLGTVLFLVGGGIGMLVFLAFGAAVARRIGQPLSLPRFLRSGPAGIVLSRTWPALIAAGAALYAFALEVAVVGYLPGPANPDQKLTICWLSLLGMLGAFFLALVGSSVWDGEHLGERVSASPAAQD